MVDCTGLIVQHAASIVAHSRRGLICHLANAPCPTKGAGPLSMFHSESPDGTRRLRGEVLLATTLLAGVTSEDRVTSVTRQY